MQQGMQTQPAWHRTEEAPDGAGCSAGAGMHVCGGHRARCREGQQEREAEGGAGGGERLPPPGTDARPCRCKRPASSGSTFIMHQRLQQRTREPERAACMAASTAQRYTVKCWHKHLQGGPRAQVVDAGAGEVVGGPGAPGEHPSGSWAEPACSCSVASCRFLSPQLGFSCAGRCQGMTFKASVSTLMPVHVSGGLKQVADGVAKDCHTHGRTTSLSSLAFASQEYEQGICYEQKWESPSSRNVGRVHDATCCRFAQKRRACW